MHYLLLVALLAFPLIAHGQATSVSQSGTSISSSSDSGAIYDVPVYVEEQADASADKAAYAQLWVNTATPNQLWFTDDTGVDYRIALRRTYTWCHTHGDVSGAPITAADHHYDYYRAPAAITVTEIWCITDAGTFTMNVENEDGSPVDIMGSDLACDAGGEVDSSPSGDTTVADGDTLSMVATSVADTPRTITWCVEYTRD